MSAATGLQFVDDGTTDEAPTEDRDAYQRERYGDRRAPVLVAWSMQQRPRCSRPASWAGRGRTTSAGPGDDARYVTGTAVFDGPALDAQIRQGQGEKAKAVLLHELGHLVGLGHVADPYQVMYDTNAYPLSKYRAGDLRGLAELGLGRCFDDY